MLIRSMPGVDIIQAGEQVTKLFFIYRGSVRSTILSIKVAVISKKQDAMKELPPELKLDVQRSILSGLRRTSIEIQDDPISQEKRNGCAIFLSVLP